MTENDPSVVTYATGLCGFSNATKKLLASKGVEFETIRVDQDSELK